MTDPATSFKRLCNREIAISKPASDVRTEPAFACSISVSRAIASLPHRRNRTFVRLIVSPNQMPPPVSFPGPGIMTTICDDLD